jgi:hypothetical protein
MRHPALDSLALSLLFVAGSALAGPPQTATLAVEKMTCGTLPRCGQKGAHARSWRDLDDD